MSEKKNEVKNEEVKNDGLAIKKEVANEVVKSENSDLIGVESFNITGGNLPDINSDLAQALPIDLMSDYWTPEQKGEQKRVFFQKIGMRTVLDQETGELLDLQCAFFIEQTKEQELKPVSNGSKRLVGAIITNEIKPGTPLLIIYKGKKKNKSNAFSSDDWSIKPIIVNIG